MERPGYTLSLLIGMMLVSSDVYDCQAEEGPIEQVVPAPAEYTRSDPDYTVYEWRLTEGDRERCRAKSGKGWPSGSRFVGLNTGVSLDVPMGERAYLRAGFRPLFTAVAPRPAAAQTRAEAGVTIAPAFLHYLDVDPVCCPASVWGAAGSGRWRAHVDYLRSTREGETVHETNVLAAWRFLERNGARAALLFGANLHRRNIRRRICYQVGAALDWPVGRRLFVRLDARLVMFRVGIGAGIGF